MVFALIVMLAGHIPIVGGCISLTVTVNEQLAELFAASFTKQLTVVVPFGNVEPDGGVQVGEPTPGQLSDTPGAAYVTTAVQTFESVVFTRLAGQVICGACMSLTVTVNEQCAELPLASCTEQVTVVTPFWNIKPDAGAQLTLPTPEQLSLATGTA